MTAYNLDDFQKFCDEYLEDFEKEQDRQCLYEGDPNLKEYLDQQYWERVLNTVDMLKTLLEFPSKSTIPHIKNFSANIDEFRLEVLKCVENNETDLDEYEDEDEDEEDIPTEDFTPLEINEENISTEDFTPKEEENISEIQRETDEWFIYEEYEEYEITIKEKPEPKKPKKPTNMIIKIDIAKEFIKGLLPLMYRFRSNSVSLLDENKILASFENQQNAKKFKEELEKKTPGIKIFVEKDENVNIVIEKLDNISEEDLEAQIIKITHQKPYIILFKEKSKGLKIYASLTSFAYMMLEADNEFAITVGSQECKYKQIPK